MNTIIEKIEKYPIVPVYYNDDVELCKSVLTSCYEGGVRVFEFVSRGAKAIENFEILLQFRNEKYPDLSLGIGTIKTVDQAKVFTKLGADFLVSPIFNKEIGHFAQEQGIVWVPGCMTPTEIAQAESLSISLVKLFPGDVIGQGFVKAVKPLFPTMKYMVTGGVSLSANNLKSWFSSGANAVGIGSKLFEGEFTNSDDVIGNLNLAFDSL